MADITITDADLGLRDASPKYICDLNALVTKWHRPAVLNPLDSFENFSPGSQAVRSLDWIQETLGKNDQQSGFFRKIVDANPDCGIFFQDEWLIMPVDLPGFLDRRRFKHIMVHRGFLYGEADNQFDNSQRLENEGVWGRQSGPTYLAPIDSVSVIPNFVVPEEAVKRKPVVIYVNADELIKRRHVFVDPEQFYEAGNPNDILVPGNAMYVVGGIPAEAIIHFAEQLDTELF